MAHRHCLGIHLPNFIPSRGIHHNEKVWYPPFSRKLCAPTLPSEQDLPWNVEVAVPEPADPQRASPKFPKEHIDASLDNYNQAVKRGFAPQPGAKEHVEQADITIFAWSDSIDLYHNFLNPELELVCVGYQSIGEYGEARRNYHKKTFGNCMFAYEFMHLEEHALYGILYKLAATKVIEGVEASLSTDLRHFAVSAVSFCAPTLIMILFDFVNAEAKKRPLSSQAKKEFVALADDIELATVAALPAYPESAPRAPQETGKLSKKQLGDLLM